jgi:hypothetical protein
MLEIPKDLINKEQSFLFLSSIIQPKPTRIVGSNGCFGLRYSIGPLAFESYACDTVPVLEPFRGFRVVVWGSISRTKSQKGWVRNFLIKSGLQEGFVALESDYFNNWSSHAKRHRKKWLADTEHEIFEASIDVFESSYNASKKLSQGLRNRFMAGIKAHLEISPENINIYLVKNKNTNQNIAGLIVTYYPDINQSVHRIAFMCQEAQKTSVGYGLIDKWYQDALKREIKWLSWGLVWKKGDPKEWQNFSLFKLQFGLHLVKRPREFLKITVNLKKGDL